MRKSSKELSDERMELVMACESAIKKAEHFGRDLTSAEKAEQDKRFARMEEIKQTENEMLAYAKMKFEKGEVTLPSEPEGKEAFHGYTSAGRFASNEPRPLLKGEKSATYFAKNGIDVRNEITLGQFVRAIVSGPKFAGEQIAVQQGFRAPSTFLLPSYAVASMLDDLRDMSAVIAAGASVVPLFDDRNKVAQVANDPTVTEASAGATTSATTNNFSGVAFAPVVLRGVVSIPRETLQDAVAGDKTIEQAIVDAMAIQFDAFALGKIDGTSGKLTVNVNGPLENYDDALDGYYQLANNNSKLTAFIMHPREQTTFAKLKDLQDQPMRRPDLLALTPFHSTTAVATDLGDYGNRSRIYAADWSKLIVGCRTAVELRVLQERYAEQHSVGVEYSVRMDAIAARPKAFCILDEVSP